MKKLLVIVSLCIIYAQSVYACSCRDEYGLGYEFYNNIKYAFVGKVTKVTIENDSRYYDIEVIRIFKGHIEKKIKLKDSGAAGCSANFEEGQTYLINPEKFKNVYEVSKCGFNTALTSKTFNHDTLFLNYFNQKNVYVDLPEFKGHLKNGKPDGDWKFYTVINSGIYLSETGSYRNGIRVGTWTHPGMTENTSSKFVFKNSGREKQIIEYLDDTTYYEWNMGFLSDKITLYNRSGKVLAKAQNTLFKNEVVDYYDTGKIKGNGKFKNHRDLEISGKWHEYDQDGKLIATKNISIDEELSIYDFFYIRNDLYSPDKKEN